MLEAGVTAQELAITIRAAIEGIESSKYRQHGDEYDIIVTYNDESVNTQEKINNITIVSQNGTVYRLSQLADVKFTNGLHKLFIGISIFQYLLRVRRQKVFRWVMLHKNYKIVLTR